MGLFRKEPIVLRWSPEADSTWDKQKLDTLYKPMKHIRCGGISIMIASLDKTAEGELVVNVSVSNYDEKTVGFNSGGFDLIYCERRYECASLKVRHGRPDFLHPEALEGKEIGLQDAALDQFQHADFTARFDALVP